MIPSLFNGNSFNVRTEATSLVCYNCADAVNRSFIG